MIDIVGIVRFSVLSTLKSPFHVYKDNDFISVKEAVLNHSRLSERFALFETITLPSLDSQSEKGFKILVVAPRLLPDQWRSRLDYLVEKRDYLHVTYENEEDFTMSKCSPLILEKLLSTSGSFFTFRIDDDDALSVYFMEYVRRYISKKHLNFALSLCKGFYLDIDPSGAYKVKARTVPNIAVGFGYISDWSCPRTLFDVSEKHLYSHLRFPVILDATRNFFLAVTHSSNDTGRKRKLDTDPMNASDAATYLRKRGYSVELEAHRWVTDHQKLPEDVRLLSRDLRSDPSDSLNAALLSMRKPTIQEEINQTLTEEVRRKSNSTNGVVQVHEGASKRKDELGWLSGVPARIKRVLKINSK